ncbi:MAG: DEAD/DEAH box helicase family protein [Desulfuromonadales bacterium]|nr:DEAD/DEAH box helicase family protein [Desulfuromonadales bacterium]
MNRFFSEKSILFMREEIVAANGNEVFFLGHTDENRIVIDVEPLARGSRDAVAAIMIAISFGDVVIHNHPTGNLTPSTADLEIAAVVGNQGVGFYIIDNSVEHCYQAVTPFSHKNFEYISLPEIEGYFAPDGLFAVTLAGYEERPEQTRMAFAVSEAFNNDKVAVIEAGTGTGKSLAYLLPAAFWAIRNKERVVLSTNTINLQEQLTSKDIPFLQKYANLQFRAALVKGRSNYLCLRKFEAVRKEPALFADNETDLEAIVSWSTKTDSGSLDDLGFIPKDEIWEEICCEADQCNRVRCRYYSRCYFCSSRRAAAGADILVVNHALLIADLVLRKESGQTSSAILPPFQRLIIDEGHHLEDVATGNLSSQITRNGLLKLLSKLQNPKKPHRGLLYRLTAAIAETVPDEMESLYHQLSSILDILTENLPALIQLVEREMDNLALGLGNQLKINKDVKGEYKLRVTPIVYSGNFWIETEERIKKLSEGLLKYSVFIGDFLKEAAKLPEKAGEKLSGQLLDIRGIKNRLESTGEALLFFIGRDENICRWFEMKKSSKSITLKLCYSPLEVSGSLKSMLFDQFKTVVITSATLAVGERFNYLAGRTGISLLPKSRISELLLASPFDYRKQAFAGVPSDMPEPTGMEFEKAAGDFILQALSISKCGAFVLFTSYDLLKRVYQRLSSILEQMGLVPMAQGEMNRHRLLSRFRKTKGGVLFGTDSFWEGVDVQGDALQLVIITRLPFRVPTEPILEARAEHITSSGGDPFMEYTVPQAVIKFKQGFGRLIRSRSDMGGVLILDSRVLTRNYGRIFLESLPDMDIIKTGREEVLKELSKYFYKHQCEE